ncbi:MAG: hypothetical protein DVB28_000097 [Verrucomicrobia bacterium]|nr:MAG: hypothetical protein DVB28_000097 [Verrucomicrobiota bacterium]
MNRLSFVLVALILPVAVPVKAATSNGNEFALALSEAKAPAGRAALIQDASGRPHFFRYLQIIEMQQVTEEGKAGFRISAFEPSSYMDVVFTVSMPVSLSILKADPVTKVGDAIAVTGKVLGVDSGKNAVLLGEPIVRQKDRLSPKIGKELLSEVNPGATFYSYTEGPRPVKLEARDRDLLQHRDRVMAAGGPKAWFDFLETEIAKRKQERAAVLKGSGQP